MLKPITTHSALKAGISYIHITVSIDGTLRIGDISFIPHRKDSGEYQQELRYERQAEGFPVVWGIHARTEDHFLTSLGVDVPKGEKDNLHRLFEDTAANRRVLEALCSGQNLKGYRKLIDAALEPVAA